MMTRTLALGTLVLSLAVAAEAADPARSPQGPPPPPPPPFPQVVMPPAPTGPAPWTLPQSDDRRATIVTGLPVPLPYRICNDSGTTAVVVTDDRWEGFDLPGRTCVDVAARNITIRQRIAGVPPHGSYRRLD